MMLLRRSYSSQLRFCALPFIIITYHQAKSMFPIFFQFYDPSQAALFFQQSSPSSSDNLPQNKITDSFQLSQHVVPWTISLRREQDLHVIQEKKVESSQSSTSENIVRRAHRTVAERQRRSMELQRVKNRNVLPNNINLLLSYVRRGSKSGARVKHIIQKLSQDSAYSQKGFYAYQAYLMQKMDPHRSKNTLRELTTTIDANSDIFPIKTQLFYNQVCRVLLRRFLAQDYKAALLTSSKIHRTSKGDHLTIRRYLLTELKYLLQPLSTSK